MGWFSDFVSDPIGTVGETAQQVYDTTINVTSDLLKPAEKVGKWSIENPVEAAALGAGGYYGYAALTAESGAAALAPVSDAGALGVEYLAPAGSGASSTWTAGQIASTVSSGLNLATSGVKLATLGKAMNASSATADGLTGALAPSPIQTPAGLITTTPNGPMVAGTSVPASTGGFMGMDNQTLFVIAAGIAAVWYFSKNAGK